ncbi:GumC family protein [Plebeiibacterium marinum]|uniref:non-specific protein-tyrosine kinase n=1 Tax=Plebeiibacterium marinum TaxID=2992111 RepID=A0AAE3SI95_9BACT|nr:polysaccharide biosynthesis tyrosine autokinase [Plebeiobacterium marinum]MCW3804159.1 polysaccharide biosynthesis tyrosine autokinase [Plebeiobacterium marinum]
MNNNNNKESKFREVGIDPFVLFRIFIKNWYFFVLTIVVAFVLAKMKIADTIPTFRVSSTVLIFEEEERGGNENEQLMQGLGMPAGMRNLDNQITILKSRDLTSRALGVLDFEVEYFYRASGDLIPLYHSLPIRVKKNKGADFPKGVPIDFTYLGDNSFKLKSENGNIDIQASFGDIINIGSGSITIECYNTDWFDYNPEVTLTFVFRSHVSLVRAFNNRLNVKALSNTGSVLEISLVGTNVARDVDFLNKLTEVFQALSLEKKNQEANRRIQFIENQLDGISDSLVITENQLQQFRSTHRVMNLSAQGQEIISQVSRLEEENARLKLEANYYDNLADYLQNDITGDLPLPISMGIEDPALSGLVTELADLQSQLAASGAGEMNPLQNLLSQRVGTKKNELMETLNGLRRANIIAISENQSQINRVNSQASALPVTERQLLGIERKFKLNDELYTLLLEKRAELQMQKASNRPDNEVINPANLLYAEQVAPNPRMIYFIALFLGSFIPFVLLFLKHLLNKRIHEEDLQRYNHIPVVGTIPRVKSIRSIEVLNNPDSVFAESYRIMRSRLQFITKSKKNPIILVTSAMPGDGKTVSAINLASVYSLLGKKTVLVEFDLRNPKVSKEFDVDRNKGISTYLIGRESIDNIIQETQFNNLSIVTAGPIPPNPSELAASSEAKEFFEQLRQRFEYVIVDSAPVGLISDTQNLVESADACLVVVRVKKTIKDMLGKTLSELQTNTGHSLSLIVNDVTIDTSRYGYGKKYGYIKT